MKLIALILVLMVSTASACRRTSIQQTGQPTLSPEQALTLRQTVMTYLECEECEQGELEAVVKLGQTAVPTLSATLRDGPSQASRELLRRQLSDTYRRLKEYEKTHPEAKVSQSEEEYVKTYLDNYIALYQVRAATALGSIGGPDAKRALEEASNKPLRDDVKATIKHSLENIK